MGWLKDAWSGKNDWSKNKEWEDWTTILKGFQDDRKADWDAARANWGEMWREVTNFGNVAKSNAQKGYEGAVANTKSSMVSRGLGVTSVMDSMKGSATKGLEDRKMKIAELQSTMRNQLRAVKPTAKPRLQELMLALGPQPGPERSSGIDSTIYGLIGTAVGGYFGGPGGAMAGGQIGSQFGSAQYSQQGSAGGGAIGGMGIGGLFGSFDWSNLFGGANPGAGTMSGGNFSGGPSYGGMLA